MARNGKVTLVGHSFGGLAITLAAEATRAHRTGGLPDRVVPVPDLPNGGRPRVTPEGQSSISGAILVGDP